MTKPSTSANSSEHRTWLKRLELKNYRCFSQLVIDLDEHLTVLIARNGMGKTTILDAVAVAFGTFVGSFYTGKGTGINNSDVRTKLTNPELHQMEPQFPVVISAEGEVGGEPVSWSRFLNSPKSNTTVKEARPLTKIGESMQQTVTDSRQAVLPLIAYYGTGRLWNQKRKTEKKIFEGAFYSRTAGYQDCLDPASSYNYFMEWFRYVARADSDLRNRERENAGNGNGDTETPYSSLIAAVRQSVDECLKITGWQGIRYSFTHQTVVMEHPLHGVLEVGQMSDGVRNMIALVADIAYRMVRLNADLGRKATKQTPGLVLIDEVDMHLHPQWQQVVLQHLTEAFPKVQFVVTTHSPQVISTVKREQVRELSENLYGEDVAVMPVMQTYGRSNADVLQSTMKVSPEPEVQESEKLKRYLAVVEQGDYRVDGVKELRAELDLTLGADHPSLIRADMTIRRRGALER